METPDFKSEHDEAVYWDKHSVANVWDEMESVQLAPTSELKETIQKQTRKRLKMVSLRLREDQIEALKIIAAKKDIPYQVLLRSWINQAIQSEHSVNP